MKYLSHNPMDYTTFWIAILRVLVKSWHINKPFLRILKSIGDKEYRTKFLRFESLWTCLKQCYCFICITCHKLCNTDTSIVTSCQTTSGARHTLSCHFLFVCSTLGIHRMLVYCIPVVSMSASQHPCFFGHKYNIPNGLTKSCH